MADALRKESDLEVELIDGNRGELTVLVDGHVVAEKEADAPPTVEQIVQAVRQAPVGAGH